MCSGMATRLRQQQWNVKKREKGTFYAAPAVEVLLLRVFHGDTAIKRRKPTFFNNSSSFDRLVCFDACGGYAGIPDKVQ